MKTKQNPKSQEDYEKMFYKLLKLDVALKKATMEIIERIKEKAPKTDYQTISGTNITPDEWRGRFADVVESGLPTIYKDLPKSVSESVTSAVDVFERNDRIETILKHYRAKLAYSMVSGLNFVATQEAHFQKINPVLAEFLGDFLFVAEPVLKPLEKICLDYLKLEKPDGYAVDAYDYEILKSEFFNELQHFMDTFHSDRVVFREIGDFSWANKRNDNVVDDLTAIERQIRKKHKDTDVVYKRHLADASETLEFMEGLESRKWYFIDDSSCSFEAYLGGHCGADSGADCFFSLRSFDKETNRLKVHVTISAKRWELPKGKQLNFSPSQSFKAIKGQILEIRQVKGPQNQDPDMRYWAEIMSLFLGIEGFQSDGHYGGENDFKPNWISLELQYDKEVDSKYALLLAKQRMTLKDSKPWWNDSMRALKEYGVVGEEFRKVFEKDLNRIQGSSVIVEEDGDVTLKFDSFWPMLHFLTDWDEKFNKVKEAVEGGDHDIYYAERDIKDSIPYDDFLAVMKKKFKKEYKKLEEALELNKDDYKNLEKLLEAYKDFDEDTIVPEVRACMIYATQRGYERGAENSRSEAHADHLNDLDLYDKDGDKFAQINKIGNLSYHESKWEITFYAEQLAISWEATGEFIYPNPVFSSGRRGRGFTDWEIEWDGGYDDEEGKYQFEEQMGEVIHKRLNK